MDKRIKILYTIPNFKTAGSQYVLLSLFRNIDRTIYDPYVCVEKFADMIPEDIPATRRLMFEWTGNYLKDILSFRSLLKKHKIDILHSWNYKSNYLEPFSTRLAGTKYCYTKKNATWSKRWWLKSLFSNHIAYDNPKMADQFFKSPIFRKKISFIPHGVDIEMFKPLGKLHRNTFDICCIGNIGSNKNQLCIINALKELPDNVILHLYGNEDKEYRAILDEYLTTNNLAYRVRFQGYVANNELPDIFRGIDLFVLASFLEGFPVSILEALACGVPVLSSDSGGGAKFLLKEGGGYIFEVNDSKSLASHINRLANNPEEMKTLSTEGRENVVINFSIQNEIANYEVLYSKFKI